VLGNGDTLIVTKLDRLARSTRDLLNTLAAIGDKGASFKSLGEYNDASGQADADGPRRTCGIRASPHPDQDKGGPTTSATTRCEVWKKAKANGASTTGSVSEKGGG
jgi:hypothetical protein